MYIGCHDLLMMSVSLDYIAILNINIVVYHCSINRVNKSEAVNLLQNADLTEKKRGIINYNFFSCI